MKDFPETAWGSVLVFQLGGDSGGAPGNTREESEPIADGGAVGSESRGAFGIELGRLLRIIEPTSLSPVPLSPAVVLGIMSFHGRIVTVIDPAPILGLSLPVVEGSESRVLLLRHGDSSTGNVGLFVSRVEKLLAPAELEATDVAAGRCVRWVLRHGERLINIVELGSLLQGLAGLFGSDKMVQQGVIG